MFKEGIKKISIEVPALGSLTPACTETARGQRTGGKSSLVKMFQRDRQRNRKSQNQYKTPSTI